MTQLSWVTRGSGDDTLGELMSGPIDWADLRDRRMAEPGAVEVYEATRLGFERGQEQRPYDLLQRPSACPVRVLDGPRGGASTDGVDHEQ
ncbi:hypothetical protein ACFY3U_02825 [Micromonospora sp. NPDC000089]|uniref:hypothetical protein n=1 Tax=unclassified Micromonospora TaxID=2617518 RepID=UPI00367D7B48